MDTSLLSIADIILSVNSRVACSVEWLGRKPYWLSEKSLLLSKYNEAAYRKIFQLLLRSQVTVKSAYNYWLVRSRLFLNIRTTFAIFSLSGKIPLFDT